MSKRVKDYLDGLRNNNIDVDKELVNLPKEDYKNIYKLMVMDNKEFRNEKLPEMDIQTRIFLNKRLNNRMWDLGYKAGLIEEIEEENLKNSEDLSRLRNEIKIIIPEVVLLQKRLKEWGR